MKVVKTVLLTSQENYVWHSMQEIIPGIVKTWQATAQPKRHQVRVFDVDEKSYAEMMPHLLEANNIVIVCFTHKLISLAVMFRKNFSTDSRYFLYLHNQASIGCWPYQVWGLSPLLRTDDVFISSCRLDAEMMKLSFKNGNVVEIPFLYEHSKKTHGGRASISDPDFTYVGRVSTQKNLHTLIYAFRIFLGVCPEYEGDLLIFGSEDHLDSPNMLSQLSDEHRQYAQALKACAQRLGIAHRVRFQGYRPRHELKRELSKNHIFVSASLHSDENFGMAALASLSQGMCAVLSDWGGHESFKRNFPKQVMAVPVQGGMQGPWIDPRGLAKAMQGALRNAHKKSQAPSSVNMRLYSEKEIARKLKSLALNRVVKGLKEGMNSRMKVSKKVGQQLVPTALALRISRAQKRFASEAGSKSQVRIFHSYADPDSHPFFEAYGMKAARPSMVTHGTASGSLLLHPWGHIDAHHDTPSIGIEDPHRGKFVLNLELGTQWRVFDWNHNQLEVSQYSAQVLLRDGFALLRDAELVRYLS